MQEPFPTPKAGGRWSCFLGIDKPETSHWDLSPPASSSLNDFGFHPFVLFLRGSLALSITKLNLKFIHILSSFPSAAGLWASSLLPPYLGKRGWGSGHLLPCWIRPRIPEHAEEYYFPLPTYMPNLIQSDSVMETHTVFIISFFILPINYSHSNYSRPKTKAVYMSTPDKIFSVLHGFRLHGGPPLPSPPEAHFVFTIHTQL